MARIQRRARGAGQERRVQHEVGIVDERDEGALLGRDALERASGVEAAEAAARDHYPPAHADRIWSSW